VLNKQKLRSFVAKVKNHPRPGRLMLAYLLKHTGLCRLLCIQRKNYRLRFHAASLPSALWADPKGWNKDSEVLERILKPGDVYIDVGANVGHLAIEAALPVGSAGQVYAFEGHPRVCAYLRENVALNRLSNVRIAQIAIGDTVGWARVSDYHADDMNEVASDGPIEVLLLPLDLIFSRLSPTLLKVDTEGYEWFVFQGARSLLQRTSFVYFEVWDQHLHKHGLQFSHLYEILRVSGLTIGEVSVEGVREVARDQSFKANTNLLAYRCATDLQSRTGWNVIAQELVNEQK
jgi:FkbM family methyltransferase